MGGLYDRLISLVPWQALVAAAFLLLVLDRTGFFQRLLRGREQNRSVSEQARVSDREQISEDIQHLIEALRDQAQQEHDWRVAETRYYQGQISGLREDLAARERTIANLSEAAILSERGNSRLRHGLDGAFQYIGALRRHQQRNGLAPVPFDGWRDLLGISPDLDQFMRDLFESVEESDKLPDRSREAGP